jgi:hypothetical protein
VKIPTVAIDRRAMEDALREINEILEWKDINDQHKAMMLREKDKRFYYL